MIIPESLLNRHWMTMSFFLGVTKMKITDKKIYHQRTEVQITEKVYWLICQTFFESILQKPSFFLKNISDFDWAIRYYVKTLSINKVLECYKPNQINKQINKFLL